MYLYVNIFILYLKGIGYQKMKILSSFTHLHVVTNMYTFLSYVEHKRRYFEEPNSCWSPRWNASVFYVRPPTHVSVNVPWRLTWKRRNCWIKASFLFSIGTKILLGFIKLRLINWCQIDYFKDILTTFLGLKCGSFVAVYGGSKSSQISYKIS